MKEERLEMTGNTIRISFIGKKDKRGEDYYFTTTSIPMLLDLSNACIHLFPWEEVGRKEDENEFGITMVFRRYDRNWRGQFSSEDDSRSNTRRRTQRKPDDVSDEVDDPNENEDEE